MKDRIPRYPGRVKLEPVAGQTNVYDMIRADEPTQEGTPLNKASLLTDETAELIWPYGDGPDDPTVDDALNRLRVSVSTVDEFKVGDIRTTRKTDLGDSWLLCNGQTFLRADYPDLVEYCDASLTEIDTGNESVYGIACDNGTWVVLCRYAMCTTTDPTGTWTRKQVSASRVMPTGISGYNGTWVAVGYTTSTNIHCPYIYDPTGTWGGKQISETECELRGIACDNGTWVAVGDTPSIPYYSYIYTTTDPTGTWTEKQLSTENTRLYDIACDNGTWVAVVSRSYPYIYTTTDPTGTWTEKQLSTKGVSSTIRIACDNGTWVVATRNNNNNVSILTNEEGVLPSISTSGAYTYIKGKE